MKKFLCILSCSIIILFVIALVFVGYREKVAFEERKEFLKKLDMVGLISDMPLLKNWRTSEIYTTEYIDGVIFFPKKYDLYAHAYEIFGGEEEISSTEDVKELIENFDSKKYDKFNKVYSWLAFKNGKYIVEVKYNDSTKVARDLYNQKYKDNILPGGWLDWKLEDRIKLEKFIRENPDFMPKEEYADVLRWLGIN